MHGKIDRPPANTRRGQVYDYICTELAHGRRSPALPAIARQFGFSVTRAKQLVDDLVEDGWITRVAGAWQAIEVPGRARALAIEILRAEGFTVDEDNLEVAGGLSKLQLPVFPDLVHIPDELNDVGDAFHGDQRKRA